MKKGLLIAASCMLMISCGKIQTTQKEQYILVKQPCGPELGYSPASGVTLLKEGKRLFKDLNRNG
jgi:beta-glucosidase